MIGNDSNGVAALKVTKSDADDPATTPDSEPHKFLVNSNLQVHPRVVNVIEPDYLDYGGYVKENYPSGSTDTNYIRQYTRQAYSNGYDQRSVAYTRRNFPDWRYDCPLLVAKHQDDQGKYVNNIRRNYPRGEYGSYGLKGGRDTSGPAFGGVPLALVSGATPPSNYPPDYSFISYINKSPVANVEFYKTSIVVFDLPGDHSPLNEAAPRSGNATSIIISDTRFDIAKPGYSADTADLSEMAFSLGRPYGGVIAADDIACAANATTEYDLGEVVDASTVADVQFYPDSSEYYYPAAPDLSIVGGRYYISGSKLYIENEGVACRARFMIHAQSNEPATTGSNVPFNQFVDGQGKEVLQILRPGSGQPPNFSDIYFDSRRPHIQLLAEGSIFPASGNQSYDVNFTNTGFLPFVVMSVIRQNSFGADQAFAPEVSLLRYNNANTGATTYAKIHSSNDKVTFYTHIGNYFTAWWTNAGSSWSPNYQLQTQGETQPVKSIKYYIFGIPT